VAEFKKKHDDMFDSVSGLNKRIDELEEHKIHLLEKLKSIVSFNTFSYFITYSIGRSRWFRLYC